MSELIILGFGIVAIIALEVFFWIYFEKQKRDILEDIRIKHLVYIAAGMVAMQIMKQKKKNGTNKKN
jgi:hypothetical protein